MTFRSKNQLTLSTLVLALAGSSSLAACSAIVNPDLSQLTADAGAGECDDEIRCTVDTMGEDECLFVPDDELCDEGERCSPVSGCLPLLCTEDDHCDDGDSCNGDEICDPGDPSADPTTGCVVAVACDDGVACTVDSCDADGECVHTPSAVTCNDGVACTVDDCDPGASGAGADGCVNSADDALCNDGFCETGGTCTPTGCQGSTARDCSDADACTVDSCDPVEMECLHDSGTEVCGNGIDDDCDDAVDETCPPAEICATEQEITIDGAGMGTVNVTLDSFMNSSALSCAGNLGTGKDAYYYFDLDALSDVRIWTTSAANVDTVVHVFVGGDCDGATPTVCNDDQDSGTNTLSSVWLHRAGPVAAGTQRIHVVVEHYDSSKTGSVVLNVRVQGARADSCAEPLDISPGGTVLGQIGVGVAGSFTGTCSNVATEREGVFRASMPADGTIQDLTARSTAFVPDLYVRTSPCASGTQAACAAGTAGSPSSASVSVTGTPSAVQYIFVDGAPDITGRAGYTLTYNP